ncbi:prephenate dehydrogenase [Nocardiopsis sp. RSe5-2]|uniref:Prephenate dehydrogenase n=1 Tax=Nocardiopsis endophytica TaxID=3018445 RepID=A0ABT4UCT9_9ACTN|nr:prephenate dehydrogenase [Nocardiopsis endophytica]MDA2814786.1 prephenate dehydrogenase [Nocardiopsis endophytica]
MIDRAVVIGAGLIGTSVALALRGQGVRVLLDDPDPRNLRIAHDMGAGEELGADPGPPADVAVIAAPPAAVPVALLRAQRRNLAHVYTDAASVKARVAEGAARAGCDMSSFVPGHPMGGREKSGPGAARSYLFEGRSWAVCPTPEAGTKAVAAVTELARLCGADPVVMDAAAHDRAVALVSHAPHLASSAVAARLAEGDAQALRLAGQGVRDVTRIAGGDPALWTEILGGNPGPVAEVLEAMAADLSSAAGRLREEGGAGLEGVRALLERGVEGRGRIPGKHGEPSPTIPRYTEVPVVLPDEPGALGRLFSAVGEAGVNIEDVRMDHSPGQPLGLAQLAVLPEAAEVLVGALRERGWSVHI